jgi:NAD(P)-dependent dehydrogenase (short-subunit alcohol dehydrogenase family)
MAGRFAINPTREASMRLKDKVSVITGAGTGIGEAVAFKFAREGAKVVLAGLSDDPVDDVAQRIRQDGGTAAVFKGDLADEASAKACIQLAVDSFGRLDVLVNNAGVLNAVADVDTFPTDRFDAIIRANLRTTFLMTRFAIPHLQRTRGSIVSAGSEAGWNGTPKATPYGGTKAFIHAFMKGVALEQAPHGVRANCVCPGPIDTAWTHHETGPIDEQSEQLLLKSVPLGRRGTPEEIANIYAFLASDEASYVTGALWLADGGITVAHGNVGELVPDGIAAPPKQTLPLSHSRDGNRNKSVFRVA